MEVYEEKRKDGAKHDESDSDRDMSGGDDSDTTDDSNNEGVS